jgi:hypothetical protein
MHLVTEHNNFNLTDGMIIKHDRLLVPVQLIIRILKDENVKPFQLYLWLKVSSDGVTRLSEELNEFLKKKLNYSTNRSIYNQLRNLECLNWIGINKKTGWVHIRSIDHLSTTYEITSSYSSLFFPKEHQKSDAFLYASANWFFF